MKFNNLFKRIKPHFFYNDKIICSSNNQIIEIDENYNKRYIVKLNISFLEKIIFKSNYLSRLLRLGIRSSIHFKDIFFFSFKKKIYSYDVKNNILSVEHKFRRGRGPLSYTCLENIDNFDDGLIFGEYFGNNSRDEVHIYKRKKNSEWEIIYTFKKGSINHIHSIVVDKIRNCLWILAGDFDHSSSIWKVEKNFKTIQRVAYGKQIYRSCFAYPTKEGLIYATDTQLETNSIRLLKIDGKDIKSEEIHKINGTCIYGCELKDYLVFSTSTEPTHHATNKLYLYFDNRPGIGILKNRSEILLFNKKDYSLKNISSFDKDFLPYGLFGLGTIMFPSDSKNNNTLYAFLSGSKNYDQDTIIYNLDSPI